MSNLKTGAQLIAEERERQQYEEGHTSVHDDLLDDGDLTRAAMAYLQADDTDLRQNGEGFTAAWSYWPWEREWWKPKDRLSNLIRAGALIAAEIDKMQRKAISKIKEDVSEGRMNKGYTCACGKYNEFSMYVFAHWHDLLTHACDCGRKNKIMRGYATIGRLTKKQTTKKSRKDAESKR